LATLVNSRFFTSTLCCASAAILLAACGGGGSGAEGTVDTTAATSASVQAQAGSQSEHTNAPEGAAAAANTAANSPAPSTNAPAASAPAAATPGPYGQNASAYTLTFSDEFENGFDWSKWNDTTWDKPSPRTINYAVEDGSLKIWPARDANGNFFPRVIDTDGKFYQTYGYFEIEAKLPIGRGVWPAFWLYNHDHPDPFRPEIDIMEAYPGGGPASGWGDANLHPIAYAPTIWTGAPGALGGTAMIEGLPDLSAGYHKYALKWEPGKQTFYFDGKEVYSANVSMPDRMYVMLDILYGSASGQPDHTTPTGKGNSFDVKYVRVWQFKK